MSTVCSKCGELKEGATQYGTRCGARCPVDVISRHRCRLSVAGGSVFCEFHRREHDESHTEYKRLCVGLVADVERANTDISEDFDSRSGYDIFLKRVVPQ